MRLCAGVETARPTSEDAFAREHSQSRPRPALALTGVRMLLKVSPVLWVVGFEEHLELNAVGVLECQYRTVFALGDRGVMHAELLEPR